MMMTALHHQCVSLLSTFLIPHPNHRFLNLSIWGWGAGREGVQRTTPREGRWRALVMRKRRWRAVAKVGARGVKGIAIVEWTVCWTPDPTIKLPRNRNWVAEGRWLEV